MAKKERVIRQIYLVKYSNQLKITIPKDAGFKAGDYVEVLPVPKREAKK